MKRATKRKPSRRRATQRNWTHEHHQPGSWGVLIYLAGDTTKGAPAVRRDLAEILKAGSSKRVHVVVQHDGPQGAGRYVVGLRPTTNLTPMHSLGRLDSSAPETLLSFLRWGLSVCPAERIALVLRSPMVISPANAGRDPDQLQVFSLAYDEASNGHLDVGDMAGAIRGALTEAGRARIDVLAIDSCQVQFLELAYELDDLVHVLIAPQSTTPRAGWNYRKVLAKWKTGAVSNPPVSTPQMARTLVEEIVRNYSVGRDEQDTCAVSALDLRRLDDVAQAFDNLCISTLQVLGEGLIWRTRQLLLKRLSESSGPVYDCGSFFVLWKEALEAMADDAHRYWLATTLEHTVGTRLDAFCEAAARYVDEALRDTRRGGLVEAAEVRRASITVNPSTLDPTALDRVRNATAARLDHAIELMKEERNESRGRDVMRMRLKQVMTALRGDAHQQAGKRLTELQKDSVVTRIRQVGDNQAGRVRSLHAWVVMSDALLRYALLQAFSVLPTERQFDLERMVDSIEGARRIAEQSKEARLALTGDNNREGMLIALRSIPDQGEAWPRWSGVSMYRPPRLDDLMKASYARFAFHRRVHWAALLGAANLIEDHPRALWRLVSSLLATGSGATRRDVLRRLTGADSVVWGLRDQFQVMTPAPTLTLSLERRGAGPGSSDGAAGQVRENYLLRLEAVNRGAVVTEQESRVQPKVMDRALEELTELLREPAMTVNSLKKLRSIGGLLGEDIFQSLGRTLEEERLEIAADGTGMTPHLQLQIPGELMKYPWELMHQNGEWLGERYAMGRQVFMQTGLARRIPARRQGRIRPLIIGDPILAESMKKKRWAQLAGARAEAEQVAAFFEVSAQEAGSFIDFDRKRDVKIHETVTCADMRALLRDGRYDIVHFAGHGIFESRDPETSAWILSDGELWSLEIRNTLAAHPAPPWLVYANACEAGMDAGGPPRKYQGNVFGLATAFINQGVAAYIGPLWPIEDLMAQHIALNFYHHLLRERLTLGESLRRSKMSARQIAYPEQSDLADEDDSFAALGWASLVLYGDPTEELYQALAGGSTGASASRQQQSAATVARSANGGMSRSSAPAVHVADRVAKEWVSGPGMLPVDSDRRGPMGAAHSSNTELELIEDAGLRRWRLAGTRHTRGAGSETGDGLPGSPFAGLLADDRIRWLMPRSRGMGRVIGRWSVRTFENGTAGLVNAYDVDQVPREGLFALNGDDSNALKPFEGSRSAGGDGRALLLLHGTLSRTALPVNAFGADFMRWLQSRYAHVLGFDHWTLSKSPEENARTLVECLRASAPHLLKARRLDIIAHSRGGLVARALCDLLEHRDAVGQLIFLGTPNCGTDLGNPKKWGTLADVLVNMSGVRYADLLGRLAGLLARLAAERIEDGVPGLLAQNPEDITRKGSFLCRLQQAGARKTRVKYGIICAEFEPTALVPNLRKLATSAVEAGLDLAADAFFAGPNDLVVNTAHAWSIGATPEQVLQSVPKWIDPSRVLLFKPPHTNLKVPQDITIEASLGVHHINLFSQPKVHTTIQQWLSAGSS